MRDFEFGYMDYNKRTARHRVRMFPTDNWTTILVTDRSEKNKCASVTNSIEYLMTELVDKEHLNPERIVVIEHYDDARETFDLVKLEHLKDGRFVNPEWTPISREEVEKWCGIAEVKG